MQKSYILGPKSGCPCLCGINDTNRLASMYSYVAGSEQGDTYALLLEYPVFLHPI